MAKNKKKIASKRRGDTSRATMAAGAALTLGGAILARKSYKALLKPRNYSGTSAWLRGLAKEQAFAKKLTLTKNKQALSYLEKHPKWNALNTNQQNIIKNRALTESQSRANRKARTLKDRYEQFTEHKLSKMNPVRRWAVTNRDDLLATGMNTGIGSAMLGVPTMAVGYSNYRNSKNKKRGK